MMSEVTHSAVTMEELLADFELTAARWKAFFAANPGAADVPTDIARAGTVGALIWHIYAASVRHSERILGETVSDLEGMTPVKELSGGWELQARAAANMRRFLQTADEAALSTLHTFTTRKGGDVSVTWRKLYLHICTHAIRHWAQIGTTVRQAGYPSDWQQDLLYSHAIR
jgi:uncharacterized damage-inducible protein DinB